MRLVEPSGQLACQLFQCPGTGCLLHVPGGVIRQDGLAETEQAKCCRLVNALVNKLHLIFPPQGLPPA